MSRYTKYKLYQKYEIRGDQERIPIYPNTFSINGDGTMPLVIVMDNDPDCGYTGDTQPQYRWYPMPISSYYYCEECPTQYRWVNMDISTYYECVGTSKYYKQKKQYTYDGTNWYDFVPEETQRGELYQTNSPDCGYIEPQYRTTSGTPYCSGTHGVNKYVDVYSQVSYNGGQTWTTTATTTSLVESNSYDCGYRTRSYSGTPYCNGYDKYVEVYSQVSYDSGSTWTTTATTTSLVEHNSEDCGYVPSYKLVASYNGGQTYSVECNSSSTITTADTRPSGYAVSAMTSAEVGDCVTTIGGRAFGDCTSLTSVTIPNSVTSIGNSAFYGCSGLTSVNIPSGVTNIGAWCFVYCSNLREITIPSGVTSINDLLFSNCTSLTSVTMPSGVTTIGTQAFYRCTSLSSVTIPNTVTSIGNTAFSGCTSLRSIEIPSSVTSIDHYAFQGCSGLTSVTINATTPPTLGSNAFASTNNCPIYVPCQSVEAYKTAGGWSDYANRIQCYVPPAYSAQYLTFVATESGTFKFRGNSISYSLDNGGTWISLASDTNSPTVESGHTIMWKASGLTPTSSNGIGRFYSTNSFTVKGNVMSLLYGDDFVGQTSLVGKDYAFTGLFYSCTGITSAENLSLPATTLADRCYQTMFIGCSSLATAPQLPATTLATYCYADMFGYCTSLTTAPVLSATTLADRCYSGMFLNCSNLNNITCLATDISASNCTLGWVNGVASSGTFIKASNMSSWTSGSSGIPNNWTVQNA